MEQEADSVEVEELTLPEYDNGTKSYLMKYRDYFLMVDFPPNLKSIPSFEVREDDIWIVTFPKAGTTWLQEIVYLVMNNADTGKALQIIYIYRNPKDTVVSYHSFFVKFLSTTKFTGNFEDFCRLFTEGKVLFGPWWKHVTEAWARRHGDNFLLLCYEDLQVDLNKNVRVVAEFLGKSLTDDQVSLIVKHCSFDSMKNNNSVNYEWYKDQGVARKEISFLRNELVPHSAFSDVVY
ncbi:sulfotransferase [Plakobranchus ocellatus]|uniref:Sulfotransferase n=1 Tax=Plakobranchus ocellatus TaxID=259542 RepID=A0AAV4AHQ9_9GAST|nr:sulfotransferase [Plakobranchus ocellatus]